jgi:hypothetical protein
MKAANRIADTKIVHAAIWFTRCCLKCLEKIVMWFNRNIQVYAAISGAGYCKSLGGAMKLLLGKFMANLFAKSLTSLFIFIGKIIITAVGGVVCGVICYYQAGVIQIAPALVSAAGCFVLSYYVLEIVKLVIDTIYFCYLYEETFMQREREAGAKPYAPGDLIKLL